MKLRVLFFLSLFLFSGLTIAKPHVTLKEKIGQMILLGFDGKTVDQTSPITEAIYKHQIGGVILFDYNYKTKTFDKNIESPEQLKNLTDTLKWINKKSYHGKVIPLFISIDYEGGSVNRLKDAYGFPATMSAVDIANLNDEDANNIADTMAATLKDNGINLDFAPVVDVNVNPDNPVIGGLGRSFSNDPAVVTHYASLFSSAFQKQKINCAYKHFPGHGSSTADSHLGFVDVTDTWIRYELDPYINLLNQNNACEFVMTAHIVNKQLDDSGLPATLSKKILTDLLRNEMNFKGVIITDDMQMKAIANEYGFEEAIVKSINAGADMLLFGNQLVDTPVKAKEIVDVIYHNVKSGNISIKRINNAYEHIMRVKLQEGDSSLRSE